MYVEENFGIRHRYALLIGVSDYLESNYRKLPETTKDVCELEKNLKMNGYTVRSMHTGHTDPKRKPTHANIWAEIRNIAGMTGAGDLLLIHFGGHGDLDKHNEAYLIPSDGRRAALEKTAINLEEFKQVIVDADGQAKILFLDACHSGIGRNAAGMPAEFEQHIFLEARGTATLAACRRGEYAINHKESGHGVFTFFLLEGLKGAAVQKSKRFITFNDLNDFVTYKVKSWAISEGWSQRPNACTWLEGDPPLVDCTWLEGAPPLVDCTRKKNKTRFLASLFKAIPNHLFLLMYFALMVPAIYCRMLSKNCSFLPTYTEVGVSLFWTIYLLVFLFLTVNTFAQLRNASEKIDNEHIRSLIMRTFLKFIGDVGRKPSTLVYYIFSFFLSCAVILQSYYCFQSRFDEGLFYRGGVIFAAIFSITFIQIKSGNPLKKSLARGIKILSIAVLTLFILSFVVDKSERDEYLMWVVGNIFDRVGDTFEHNGVVNSVKPPSETRMTKSDLGAGGIQPIDASSKSKKLDSTKTYKNTEMEPIQKEKLTKKLPTKAAFPITIPQEDTYELVRTINPFGTGLNLYEAKKNAEKKAIKEIESISKNWKSDGYEFEVAETRIIKENEWEAKVQLEIKIFKTKKEKK